MRVFPDVGSLLENRATPTFGNALTPGPFRRDISRPTIIVPNPESRIPNPESRIPAFWRLPRRAGAFLKLGHARRWALLFLLVQKK